MKNFYFARINFFSEEFTKDRDHESVLGELKRILEREDDIDALIEDKKIVVDLSVELNKLIISAEPYVTLLSSDSQIQLHPKSKYYFVDKDLWKRLQEDIFLKAKSISGENELDIQDGDDFFELVGDCAVLENYFSKKLLVFEAS